MKIVNTTADICDVEHDGIRCLLQKRFLQQCGATFFVVEPGDSIEDLETKTGCPIVTSWLDDARYGDEDFEPSWEYVEAFNDCYKMVFVLNDDSSAICIIIPKDESINVQLRNLCEEYADYVPL